MTVRRLSAALPLAAILLFISALASPAGAVVVAAAAPPAVATVTVTEQEQGPDLSWRITATWDTSAGADGYRISIANAAGTATYKTKDVGATTSTTLTTPDLLDGHNYRISVVAFTGDDEAAPTVSDPFEAIALDRTAPTGTFTIAPTQAWLTLDLLNGDENGSASVTIKQVEVSDDTSPTITRQVLAGDGTSARAWTSGTSTTITYTKAGTFTPKVQLTDGFGNVGLVPLSPVTISDDHVAPVVRVTAPAPAMRDRVRGWRHIRGTAVDTGTGVDTVIVYLLQKRGGIWYVYHFGKQTWIKGRATQNATLTHVKLRPAILSTDSMNRWHTGWIRGLRTGKLVIHTGAFDKVFNIGVAPVVRQRITRR